MKISQSLFPSFKESPSEAVIISHQLMLRSAMIKQLSSGLYSWLPLGLKVLKKIENIVREEMDKSGAQEILMPMVQPAELWQQSGRIKDYGPELTKFKDRNNRLYCLGPTHEEVVSDIINSFIKSYKQLPLNLYQIQTKFRDEIRPRFGVLRAREFIMKDAYSFHTDQESLEKIYQVMYQTYCNIFKRIGMRYKVVLADSGSIGGNKSHEFHLLAQTGEDLITYTDDQDDAFNVELMPTLDLSSKRKKATQTIQKLDTKGCISVEQGAKYLGINKDQILKVLLVKGKKQSSVALVIRGDYELNEVKAQKHPLVASPLEFISKKEIKNYGLSAGSIGPYQLKEKFNIEVIADYSALAMSDFYAGANEEGYHFSGLNWDRDIIDYHKADLRQVSKGDIHPTTGKALKFARGIEVGHIFQLGDKYSIKLNANFLNEKGQSKPLIMGCYGIGISRIVAACIEQNYDQNGIIWPKAIAPFDLALVLINPHKSEKLRQKADEITKQAKQIDLEVLQFDNQEGLGSKLAQADLMGIGHQMIIGQKGLDQQQVEIQTRTNKEKKILKLDQIKHYLKSIK